MLVSFGTSVSYLQTVYRMVQKAIRSKLSSVRYMKHKNQVLFITPKPKPSPLIRFLLKVKVLWVICSLYIVCFCFVLEGKSCYCVLQVIDMIETFVASKSTTMYKHSKIVKTKCVVYSVWVVSCGFCVKNQKSKALGCQLQITCCTEQRLGIR